MTLPEIVRWVIESFEGKLYTDDPVDNGGATKFGITLRTLQYYRRKMSGNPALIVSKADVANLTIEEATDVGTLVFGIEPGIVRIQNWPIQLAVYDYGFHSGQPRAISALQESMGFPLDQCDGKIGPATIAAVDASDKLQLALRVLTTREEFMQDIMERRNEQRKWMLGWWKRTTKLQRLIVS